MVVALDELYDSDVPLLSLEPLERSTKLKLLLLPPPPPQAESRDIDMLNKENLKAFLIVIILLLDLIINIYKIKLIKL
jgi:hypothetical protein